MKLLPHYYQTAWFSCLVGLAIAAGLFGVYRWSVRRLQVKQIQLQASHDLLETRVNARTAELRNEIEERKRIEQEVERIHKQLVDASRQAGQAEVASSVLHNVGNVLNSVNVSVGIIGDRVRASKALGGVSKIADLLDEHRQDLAGFLAEDGKADKVTSYLKGLAQQMSAEREGMLGEIQELNKNIEHIKGTVAMQQNYARISGVLETQSVAALVEDALRMNAASLARHQVRVVRQFDPIPDILLDRHKVLQILVNLIANAKHALSDAASAEATLNVGVRMKENNTVQITVADNGVGIDPKNLTRIFSHGFTTRKDGHGFGLHSGILAAREMGGTVLAHSDGPGKGATFTLELPSQPKQTNP
jgi:C4-dicarboxylate-specific signal transduction histidine kinase